MNFAKCIQSCNHQHNEDLEQYFHCQISNMLPPLPPLSNNLFSILMVLAFLECNINEIIRYIVFWGGLASFT